MRISIFLFLVAFSLSCFAQNWSLMNANYEYHYALNREYNTTIKVDSVETNGTDTTFFLNRIVTACDSCINAGSDEYLRYNQPTFLQRQVLKQGSKFTFSDTSTFLLKPNESLNTTWLFDAANNISAEIIAVNQEVVFGVLDSVKIILLTTNDTLKVSKNNGFYFFKNYKLSGIKKPNQSLGFILPNYLEFFDFSVGDVFQYEELKFDGSIDQNIIKTIIKRTILSKSITNNEVIYSVNDKKVFGDFVYFNPLSLSNLSTENKTLQLVYNDGDQLVSAYNNELINSCDNSFWLGPAVAKTDTDGLFLKASDNLINSISVYEIFNDFLLTENQTSLPNRKCKQYLKEGLGETLIEYENFEQELNRKLVGYIKNGVQTGEIWEDWRFTEINELERADNLFTLFPNPAKNTLKLSLEDNYEEINVEITNLVGEIIFENTFKNETSLNIDLSKFSSGIYFINVETDKSYSVKKFVKD